MQRPSRRERAAAVSIVKTKSRIPRESVECKALRLARRTEKIETLGSSRMTKILEEIGAESDAGIKLNGEGGWGQRVFSLESKGRRRRREISKREGKRNLFPFFSRPATLISATIDTTRSLDR